MAIYKRILDLWRFETTGTWAPENFGEDPDNLTGSITSDSYEGRGAFRMQRGDPTDSQWFTMWFNEAKDLTKYTHIEAYGKYITDGTWFIFLFNSGAVYNDPPGLTGYAYRSFEAPVSGAGWGLSRRSIAGFTEAGSFDWSIVSGMATYPLPDDETLVDHFRAAEYLTAIQGNIKHSIRGIQSLDLMVKTGVEFEYGERFEITDYYTNSGATTDSEIFVGNIRDIDKYGNPKIRAVSRVSELNSIFPSGNYAGTYGEIMGELINEHCNFCKTGTISIGNISGNFNFNKSKSLYSIINDLTISEKWLWAATPRGLIDANPGNISSDVVILPSQAKVMRGRALLREINRVELYSVVNNVTISGIVEDIDSQGKYGTNLYVDWRSDVSTQDELLSGAQNILDTLQNPPLRLEVNYNSAPTGYIQPGQTVEMGTGHYFAGTLTPVPTGDYIIESISYNPTRSNSKLTLIDGLTFTKDYTGSSIEDNKQRIAVLEENMSAGGITEAQAVQAVEDAGLVLSPTKVITSADADLDFNFGRTALGDAETYGDYALLAYIDMIGTPGQYAVRQNPTGETYLNSASGKSLFLCIDSEAIATITATALTMAQDIAMGGNAITNVGNVDGVDVSTLPALIAANTTPAEVLSTVGMSAAGVFNVHISASGGGILYLDVGSYLDIKPSTDTYGIILRDSGSSDWGNFKNVNGITYIGDGQTVLANMIAINSTAVTFPPGLTTIPSLKLAADATIHEFDTDVNLAGGNVHVPTSLAVKTYIDASAGGDISQAEFDAAHGYGSGNKLWRNASFESGYPAGSWSYYTLVRNAVGGTIYMAFIIDLPHIKSGRNLTITRIQVGLLDADGDDYVDSMTITAFSSHTANTAVRTDGTNLTSPQLKTYDIADVALNPYYKAVIWVQVVSTSANQFEISFVRYEYYYA